MNVIIHLKTPSKVMFFYTNGFYTYGYNSKFYDGFTTDIECKICSKAKLDFHCHRKYYHFMWIPCLPGPLEKSLACSNCNNIVSYDFIEHRINPEIIIKYITQCKTSWWMFLGPIIAIVIALCSFFTEYTNTNKIASANALQQQYLINNPTAAVSYIYYDIEDKPYPYSYLKIVNMNSEKTEIKVGNKMCSSIYQAETCIKEKKFSEEVFIINNKENFLELYKNLKIIKAIQQS